MVLAGMSVVVFVFMLLGSGSFSDPATLVSWGASIATHTTNGEWWRLLTMTFVHVGLFHMLVEVAALVSVGLVLERLLGSLAFAGIYVAAALLGGLVSVSSHPMTVSVGGSGAIFGSVRAARVDGDLELHPAIARDDHDERRKDACPSGRAVPALYARDR